MRIYLKQSAVDMKYQKAAKAENKNPGFIQIKNKTGIFYIISVSKVISLSKTAFTPFTSAVQMIFDFAIFSSL